jgi:hypothetical protein
MSIHITYMWCFLTRLDVNFIVPGNNHIRIMIFGMWVKIILFESWLSVSEVGEHVQKKLWQRIELYGCKPIPPVYVDVTDWTQHEHWYCCKPACLNEITCKSQWRHYCFVWEQFVRIKTAPPSSSYNTAIYDAALLSIRRHVGAYESVVSEGNNIIFCQQVSCVCFLVSEQLWTN